MLSTGLPSSTTPFDMPRKAGELFEEIARDWQQDIMMDELAQFVTTCFQDARRHKTNAGVDQEIMKCLRAVNNQYDPEDVPLLNGIDIYVGLTNLKARALKAWLTDILAGSEDQPWTLKPTPLPELPPYAEEAVLDALERELAQYGDAVDIKARAKFFKDLALQHSSKIAAEAVSRMETAITDVMYDSGWRDTFSTFVADLSSMPNAIIKGPFTGRQPALRWQGNTMVPVDKVHYRMERVHPLDMFPSPNSTNPNDGSYLIERKRIFPSDMQQLQFTPGFIGAAVRKVLAERPDGVRDIHFTDAERSRIDHTDQKQYSPTDKVYDTLIFNGKVAGAMLQAHGVDVADPQELHEAEVWVCGHVVLKAILNPHPTGQRGYYTTSFELVPGSFWGRGLPTLLRATQRMCNAAARSLVRNMSFASGPIGEYDTDRLVGETNIDEIRPFRMYAVTTDPFAGSSQSAIRFNKIDSNAPDLLRVYEHWSSVADEIIGMPKWTMGDPHTAGGGRTLGGLSMLMGNAGRGIKHLISNIDKHVVEPVVYNFYTLMMLFSDDETIKADASVIARGSSGLLQRELQQSRALEVLRTITPYVQAGLVPPEGLLIVLRDVLRGLGYNTDDIIPDIERQNRLMATQQKNAVASTAPKTDQPKLDNRSKPAIQASEASRALPPPN